MRQEKEHNARAWLAYHIAALSRTERMPRYEKLLMKQAAKPADWEKQLANLKAWVVATGGKIIVKPRDEMNG